MSVLKQRKALANHNLSHAFQASVLCLKSHFKTDYIDTELVDFKSLQKNEEQRNAIWSGSEQMAEQMAMQDPGIRAFLEDLLVYEKAIWDLTFLNHNTQSYREKRMRRFEEVQKITDLENKKFKINKEEPFNIVLTKWDWNSGNPSALNPVNSKGAFHYFIRPSLFNGTVLVKKLQGIDKLFPLLLSKEDVFSVENLVALIKDGALPDYEIHANEKVLRERVLSFIKEHLLIYNSISIASVNKEKNLTSSRKSFTL